MYCYCFRVCEFVGQEVLGGNVSFKIDINKAFDTLSWFSLLWVLKAFGFYDKLCAWIDKIFQCFQF